MKKEAWSKPELIILARSTPGEDILTHCKSVNHAPVEIDGTQSTGQLCKARPGNCGACLSEGGAGAS